MKTNTTLTAALMLGAAPACLFGHGIFRTGLDAQTMGRAGIDIVGADTPTAALTSNPAGLAGQANAVQGTVVITGYYGTFSNPVNPGSDLQNPVTPFPTGAFSYQLEDNPDWTLGVSLAPDSALRGYWNYNDVGPITYGQTTHDSRLITYRLAFGAGYQATDELSLGATVGVSYNDNYLKSPYTFQNAFPVTGAKVLLDLETTGWGPNFSLGAEYEATDWLSVGVRYISPTWLYTEGNADGFIPGAGYFSYNAAIDQQVPQRVGIGVAVEPLDWLSLFFQVDWVDYAGAYDTLEISLDDGANVFLPTSFTERSPLNWESVFVFAVAAEAQVTDDLALSVGYSYGESPVPDSTLTPLTAAIMEQTISAGLTYRLGDWEIGLAYQFDVPHSQTTTTSILLNGEYQNSTVEVGGHTGAVSLTWYY